MPEQTISGILEYLIKLHGISILELSKKTKIPQPTLHHILSGETKNPRKQALNALADFFSITIEQLKGKALLPKVPTALKESLNISTVPIIEWHEIKALFLGKLVKTELKEVILDKNIGPHSFALNMKDASMQPLIPENSLLIFDTNKVVKDRDMVIVLLNKNDILFNRLFIDGPDFYIKHHINDIETSLLKLRNGIDKIIASLIEVRLQF